MTRFELGDAISDAIARIVAVAGLGGIALIHVLQAPAAFGDATYLGILFVLAIIAAVVLAAVLTVMTDERVWESASGLPALLLIGYVLSRTSGLPSFTEDVGEWTEPLGLASLVVEGLVLCVSFGALAAFRRPVGSGAVRPAPRRVPPGAAPAA